VTGISDQKSVISKQSIGAIGVPFRVLDNDRRGATINPAPRAATIRPAQARYRQCRSP
jgi:hypothetical protein